MYTINDIKKEDYQTFKNKIIDDHYHILKKYLSYFEICRLRTSFIEWFKKKICDKKFRRKEGEIIKTNIRYGHKQHDIPIEFDTVMSAILEKNLTVSGLFRVSAPYSLLNEVESKLLKMFDEKRSREHVMKYLHQHDVILLSNIFSRLFGHFNTTLFPEKFFLISKKILKIQNEEERRICFKILFVSFPHGKRCMFEAIGKFLHQVSDEHTKFDKDHVKTMNINGICKVLAPKIFLNKNEVVDPINIFEYVSILDYMIDKMPGIIEIEKRYVNE